MNESMVWFLGGCILISGSKNGTKAFFGTIFILIAFIIGAPR